MYTLCIKLYLYVCIWLLNDHIFANMPITLYRLVGVPRSSCVIRSRRRDLQAALAAHLSENPWRSLQAISAAHGQRSLLATACSSPACLHPAAPHSRLSPTPWWRPPHRRSRRRTTPFYTIKRLTSYCLLGSICHESYFLCVSERLSCCKTGGSVRI